MNLTYEYLMDWLRRDVHASRNEGMTDLPVRVVLHPYDWEDVAITAPMYDWSPMYEWSKLPVNRVMGAEIEQDLSHPRGVVDVIWKIPGWPGQRETHRLSVGPYAQQVRDGVVQAHPWLRLPVPTCRREVSLNEPRRIDLRGVEVIVSDMVWETVPREELERMVDAELNARMVERGVPEYLARTVDREWKALPQLAGAWRLRRPRVSVVVLPPR